MFNSTEAGFEPTTLHTSSERTNQYAKEPGSSAFQVTELVTSSHLTDRIQKHTALLITII